MDRPTKITFGEMRDMGVRGVVVDCQDYKCSHSQAISADQWPMMSGYPRLSSSSSASSAASAAQMFGQDFGRRVTARTGQCIQPREPNILFRAVRKAASTKSEVYPFRQRRHIPPP
jgi:hypothetical protein